MQGTAACETAWQDLELGEFWAWCMLGAGNWVLLQGIFAAVLRLLPSWWVLLGAGLVLCDRSRRDAWCVCTRGFLEAGALGSVVLRLAVRGLVGGCARSLASASSSSFTSPLLHCTSSSAGFLDMLLCEVETRRDEMMLLRRASRHMVLALSPRGIVSLMNTCRCISSQLPSIQRLDEVEYDSVFRECGVL